MNYTVIAENLIKIDPDELKRLETAYADALETNVALSDRLDKVQAVFEDIQEYFLEIRKSPTPIIIWDIGHQTVYDITKKALKDFF